MAMTPQEKERAMAFLRANWQTMTDDEMGKHLGISGWTVAKMRYHTEMNRNGQVKRGGKPHVIKETRRQEFELYGRLYRERVKAALDQSGGDPARLQQVLKDDAKARREYCDHGSTL